MKCSVCLSTYDRPQVLHRTLESIGRQEPPFEFEVIVVDDGSPGEGTRNIIERMHSWVQYIRIDREPGYRNPGVARNVAYRAARGEVVIAQSDDVVHTNPNTIQQLVEALTPGYFVLATVINVDERGNPCCDLDGAGYGDKMTVYVSPKRKRPLFFLGALYRSDLYAVGGNDEEFIKPSREDVWFALCLTKGLGLIPVYLSDVTGHHQRHRHTQDYAGIRESDELFSRKLQLASQGLASYTSSGGSWLYTP